MSPFKDSHVLRQVFFMDAPKRPEEIPHPCPDPFHSIAVHFSYPIAIVVSCILPVRMTHRVMSPARFADVVVG
jgi:hypothetical protein